MALVVDVVPLPSEEETSDNYSGEEMRGIGLGRKGRHGCGMGRWGHGVHDHHEKRKGHGHGHEHHKKGKGELVLKRGRLELTLKVWGYEASDLKVTINSGILNVSGSHEETAPDGQKFVVRSFSRANVLPQDVNLDNVRSSFIDGKILRIEIPMIEAEQPRERVVQIPVVRN